MDSADHKVTQIYVRLDDPANADEVIKNLKAQLPSYHIDTMADYMAMFGVSNIPGVTPFLSVMVGLGVFSGAICVCLSMYMAVLQRTREIGILKSLGASKGFILGVIEAEAALLGLGRNHRRDSAEHRRVVAHQHLRAGVAAGDPRSRAGGPSLPRSPWHPPFSARFTPDSAPRAHDPIEALAYE